MSVYIDIRIKEVTELARCLYWRDVCNSVLEICLNDLYYRDIYCIYKGIYVFEIYDIDVCIH